MRSGRFTVLLAMVSLATFAFPATGSAQVAFQASKGHTLLFPSPWRPGADTVSAPLSVLDDYGETIPEDVIRSRMRRFGARWWVQPLAFIGGATAAFLAAPKGANYKICSQYDPCSKREEFYTSTAGIAGGVIGVILANAASPGVNRLQAVEKIREERREIRRDTVR